MRPYCRDCAPRVRRWPGPLVLAGAALQAVCFLIACFLLSRLVFFLLGR